MRLIAAGLAAAYPTVWGLCGSAGNSVLAGALRPLNLERLMPSSASISVASPRLASGEQNVRPPSEPISAEGAIWAARRAPSARALVD